MSFRKFTTALLFHSSTRLTADYEAARLERVTDDAKWKQYDEPTYIRKGRAVRKQERLPIFLLKQAS